MVDLLFSLSLRSGGMGKNSQQFGGLIGGNVRLYVPMPLGAYGSRNGCVAPLFKRRKGVVRGW